MNSLVPYLLEPKLVPAIWGGRALADRYGKVGPADAIIGESWECWHENRISGGAQAGHTLDDVLQSGGPALLGIYPGRAGNRFPVLTKFIDAQQSLSVQVHPDDAFAQSHEHQPNGKTECWTILEAEPNAEIILGFSRDTSADEVRHKVADGTLGDILRRIKVAPGDVYFLPAGTVHAIGAGIVLFEAQQASDLTYRLYDWNRVDAQGRARELHVDKALAVLHYAKSTIEPIKSLPYIIEDSEHIALIADDCFGVELIKLANTGRHHTESVATIITAQETPVRIRTMDDVCQVPAYGTAFVPAGLPRFELDADAPTAVFVITPPGAKARLQARMGLIGIGTEATNAFCAQFSPVSATV